ncbi:hypothetical protein [Enterovirga rhinocerotis]|uniref:PH (Pleckstrin Homology) domain-containing protein n=1 Tax=Enterovirga rhinocerotis TaxID=1339210 RepID=A0A4R7BS60_9HYPH|nr:hypothetical protein [Enterovirga rhinocerotis]TDR87305.1 hypothetical protein EV668_4386 [Enterovirga rhinocerotis]
MPRPVLYVLLAIGLLFTVAGIGMVAAGAKDGWLVAVFFSFCTAVFVWQLWPQWLEAPPALTVEEMLARYPGPVELRMNTRKIVFLLVGLLVFGGCSLWLLLTAPLGWVAAVALWIGLAFIALGIPVLAITLLRGSWLRLEAGRFVVSQGWRRWSVPWQAATGFAASRIPPSMTELVVFDDATRAGGALAGINAGITGRNGALPDNYGLPHAALADLMTAWRERAVAAKTPGHSPDHRDA